VRGVSPAASQSGVRPGMSLSEAKALLQRSTGQSPAPFYLLEHDPTADIRALQQLADSLSGFSPLIGLEQTANVRLTRQKKSAASIPHPSQHSSPASIFFDLSGIERLYGSERSWAEQLYQVVQQQHYLPRLAIADTLAMAWGISHFATPAWIVVSRGEDSLFRQLPLPALRLNEATVEILHRLGIETIAQLWDIPRDELARRLGEEVLIRIDQAQGSLAEPLVVQRQATDFSNQQILDHPTANQCQLLRIIQQLLEPVCQQLKACQRGGLQWNIQLSLVAAPPVLLAIDLFQPSADPTEVLPLIEMKLEQQWGQGIAQPTNGPFPAVAEIQIRAITTVLVVAQQRQLFDESPRLDQQGLSQLINHLASRLGAHKVVAPRISAGVQPEFNYRWQPLVGTPTRKKSTSVRPQSHVIGRPLRIFHPATPIQINCWKIGQWWGPERIETGWWRGPTVCRNYWRVETDTGQHFWIYQDLRSEQWYLHGEF